MVGADANRLIAALVFSFSFSSPAWAELTIGTGQLPSIKQTKISATIQSAYRKLGFSTKLVNYPWRRSLVMANEGQIDAELARIPGLSKRYPNLIMVPVPLEKVDVVLASINLPTISDWAELKKYRVGHIGGIIFLNQRLKDHPAQIQANDHESLLKMLGRNRIDYIIDNSLTLTKAIKDFGGAGISIQEQPLASIILYHYVHKKHENLVPKLSEIFRQQTPLD